MLTIQRKKDVTDFFAPYKYIINKSEGKISSGGRIDVELEEEMNYFQVKYLYFKSQKLLIPKDKKVKITVGSCISNYFILFIIPFIFINFFLMSYTNLDLDYLYEASKYLAIFYFSTLLYFCTFGYKKYISLEIDYL